jgi:uncharacterized membrane protein YfcA
VTLAFLAAASIGMLGGVALAGRISSGMLRRGFAWSVIALGGFLLIKNFLS